MITDLVKVRQDDFELPRQGTVNHRFVDRILCAKVPFTLPVLAAFFAKFPVYRLISLVNAKRQGQA